MHERWDAPYLRGQAAACIALEPSDNPFPPSSDDFIEWLRGYRAWEEEQGDPQRRPSAKSRTALRIGGVATGG